jgi:hypothetical protein
LFARAHGFVEEVGGGVDFNLGLTIKLPEHFPGLIFPPEHHVLERIIEVNIVAFSKDIKQNHGDSPPACLFEKVAWLAQTSLLDVCDLPQAGCARPAV